MKPLLYIAGKFRGAAYTDIQDNIRTAQLYGAAVNFTKLAYAVIPHSMSAYIESSLDDAGWLECTLELSRRCDGVLMLPGWLDSPGSVLEFRAARDEGRPSVICPSFQLVEQVVRDLVAEIGHAAAMKRAAQIVLPKDAT